jgi:hypothetical protein
MTVIEWFIIGYCTLMFVAMTLHTWFGRRLSRQIQRDLDEVRLCNAEFAEAVQLLRYGAVDEAVELAQKWRERAEQGG